ncbi:2-iminobutanoate/2-iminopropanoate deaminase [Penicillium subrubescens]|uniref:2-iminobutanoate/2-iminopropanoate deaminase n=2 Tax=Penicillium subrubescens TaxID=1316194 RepID=A0A1Q5TDZ3_9EURO|nr:2-iminobutanoate/2-iminopropanoate deaminase [Penicillium subrubescens]
MSDKHVVLTENAPPTLPGIYSQAIVANGFVYCSSCVPMDAQTGKIVDRDIKMHTHQCIKNISNILEVAGSNITKAAKFNVFLFNMDDFVATNSVCTLYWGNVKPSQT